METLKMPRFLYKAIVNKNTSIGDNPAIPNYGEFGFLYDLITIFTLAALISDSAACL